MRFVAKAQESRERDANMMMRGFVKIQTAKVLCLRLQCLERIRADVLKFTTGTEGQVNGMSDDLISRKAVLCILTEARVKDSTLCSPALPEILAQRIRKLPTAFDKEKVIEKLKDQYNYSCKVRSKNDNDYFEYWDGRTDSYKDAIEIVEKGGIE